jgi:hypothetical protein
MIRRSIVLLVLATMVAVAACASMSVHPHREIFDDVPATIDPGARYLFHMHGWVVEEYGPVGAVRTGSVGNISTLRQSSPPSWPPSP